MSRRPPILAPLLSLLLAAAAPLRAADAPSLPDGDMLAVVVPDLRVLLTHIETVVNAAQPGSMPAGTLGAKLGESLGDPTLALIDKGPLVAIVLPGMPMPKSVLMVPSTKPQDLVTAVQSRGGQAQVVGTLVAIAKDEDSLALATADAYQGFAAHPPAVDVRVLLAPKAIASTYGMFLQMMLGSLTPKRQQAAGGPDMAQMMKIARIECAVVLKLMADVDVVQDDFSLHGTDIDVVATTVATPGSGLAKALVAPVGDPAALAKVRGRVDGGQALMRWAGNMPCAPVIGYAKELINGIPEAKAMIPAAVLANMDKMMTVACDGFSATWSVDGKGALLSSAAYATKDLDAAKALTQSMLQALHDESAASNGILGGMETLTYQKDATTLVLNPPLPGPPPVDRVSADLMTVTISPALAKQSAIQFPAKIWFAYADGAVFQCSDVGELTRMLQGGPAPAAFAAEAAFPADRDGCGDVDVVAVIATQIAAVAHVREQRANGADGAAAPQPAVTVKASGKPPLCFAWSTHDGQSTVRSRVSIATITACVEAVHAAMAGFLQQGQGRGGAPQQF